MNALFGLMHTEQQMNSSLVMVGSGTIYSAISASVRPNTIIINNNNNNTNIHTTHISSILVNQT